MANLQRLVCLVLIFATIHSTYGSLFLEQPRPFQKTEDNFGQTSSLINNDKTTHNPSLDDEETAFHDEEEAEFTYLYGDSNGNHRFQDADSISVTKRCAYKCDGVCYNPMSHQCCFSTILNGFWPCSAKCKNRCGTRCYPKNGYKCCHDQVVPIQWPCCQYYCRRSCYNAATHRCCRGKKIPRKRLCCRNYCGNNCYNPKDTNCCKNQVVAKTTFPCGKKCYDKKTEQCCHNNIIPKRQVCCSPGQRLCGRSCYSTSSHQCCNNRVIRKSRVCCPPSKRLCRRTCYSTSSQQCCNNRRLIPKSSLCCPSGRGSICGRSCYTSSSQQCCKNRVIPKSRVCCPSGRSLCGRSCYVPSPYTKCCNRQLIPKRRPCCPRGNSACGRSCYSIKSHKCCHNRVIPKLKICCPLKKSVCGKSCYSTNSHKCCHNRVIQKRKICCKLNKSVCGNSCYSTNSHKCCYKRVIPKLRVCCKSRQIICGKSCYSNKSQKCCHKRVIPKHKICCPPGKPHCTARYTVKVTTGLTAVKLGCYKDTWNRAIPQLEGRNRILVGNYQKRKFAVQKCALAAAKRGWKYFAVQHGGWCASSGNAGGTYKKYGRSNACKNGKGGPWANSVYVLQGKPRTRTFNTEICVFPFIYQGRRYNSCTRKNHNKLWCAVTPNYDVDKLWGNCAAKRLRITKGLHATKIGCFGDRGHRAIPQLDHKDRLLVGDYKKRRFAIQKCALAAAKRGWTYFAVQDGGWCASSATAGGTYKKYGRSNACRHGKGGPWANSVYVLQAYHLKRAKNGEICVFPFIYRRRRYNGCRKSWCAVTPNYDVDRLGAAC